MKTDHLNVTGITQPTRRCWRRCLGFVRAWRSRDWSGLASFLLRSIEWASGCQWCKSLDLLWRNRKKVLGPARTRDIDFIFRFSSAVHDVRFHRFSRVTFNSEPQTRFQWNYVIIFILKKKTLAMKPSVDRSRCWSDELRDGGEMFA